MRSAPPTVSIAGRQTHSTSDKTRRDGAAGASRFARLGIIVAIETPNVSPWTRISRMSAPQLSHSARAGERPSGGRTHRSACRASLRLIAKRVFEAATHELHRRKPMPASSVATSTSISWESSRSIASSLLWTPRRTRPQTNTHPLKANGLSASARPQANQQSGARRCASNGADMGRLSGENRRRPTVLKSRT
jgi:hypothetical protein